MTDPITEVDLHAFIDDQLLPERRLDVEDHLARRPEVAARVMADLRARDALKLAFGQAPMRKPTRLVLEAARRLEWACLAPAGTEASAGCGHRDSGRHRLVRACADRPQRQRDGSIAAAAGLR